MGRQQVPRAQIARLAGTYASWRSEFPTFSAIVANAIEGPRQCHGRDDALLRYNNGTIIDWLGQADGSLAVNAAINLNPGTEWHPQFLSVEGWLRADRRISAAIHD